MSDVDIATESLERHEHLKERPDDDHGRKVALLIGVLAAVLSQNAYLAHHIAVSNDYAFYQGRQARALVLGQTATLLRALAPATPELQKQAADAETEAKRLTEDSPRGNGLAQIQARADAESKEREASLHRYEWFEIVTSALQIAIVLCSVSVVAQWRTVAYIGGVLGGGAAVLALLVVGGVV
jgi:hypothetical protein